MHINPQIEQHFAAEEQRLRAEEKAIEVEKERLRVLNVIDNWYDTRTFPKHRLLNGRFCQADSEHVDAIIHAQFGGVYTLETLDRAYNLFVRQEQLATDLRHYCESNPELAQTPENLKKITQWMSEHPQADISDLQIWISHHTLDGTFKWVISTEKLVSVLRLADKAKIEELKAQYGTQAVAQAWTVLESRFHKPNRDRKAFEGRSDGDERTQAEKRQKATSFFDNLKEKLAQGEAEALVSSYRSRNHADTAEVRGLLDAIVEYKEDGESIDWQKTRDARRSELQRMSNPSFRTNLR